MTQPLNQIFLECAGKLKNYDLDSLKLLFKDILEFGDLNKISTKNSWEIFKLLETEGHISSNNLAWLHNTLKRFNVIAAGIIPYVGESNENATGMITPYRFLLLGIARNLTDDNIAKIKFSLDIPAARASEISNGQHLILYMEEIFETSQKILCRLKNELASIMRNDLKSKIENFEKSQGVPAKVAQESSDNQTAPLSAQLGTTSDTNNAEANREHADSMNNGRSTMVDESAFGPSGKATPSETNNLKVYAGKADLPNRVPQTDIGLVDVKQQVSQSAHGTTSMLIFGVDVYQEDLDTLHPGELISDTMLNIMLREHRCKFPIVDTLFYSILVGEQELSVKTSTRLERMEVAERYFRPDLLRREYVFIPINRGLHWFLGVISPWHILILDSLVWDIGTRETELDNIARYVNHLTEVDVTLPRKERLHHVLKVPRQASNSNNCAVFVSLFVKYFLKDIEEYEKSPEDYVASKRNWFNNTDATEERERFLKLTSSARAAEPASPECPNHSRSTMVDKTVAGPSRSVVVQRQNEKPITMETGRAALSAENTSSGPNNANENDEETKLSNNDRSTLDEADAGSSERLLVQRENEKTSDTETEAPALSTENISSDQNNAEGSDEQTKLLNNGRSTMDEFDAGPPGSENKRTSDMETQTAVLTAALQGTVVDDPTAPAANDSNKNPDGNSNMGEGSKGSSGSILSVDLENIELFEKEVVSCFQKKVHKYEDNVERPAFGRTEIGNNAAQGLSFATGITATAVGLTITAGTAATAATAGIAGPVILGTALIGSIYVKVRRREKYKGRLKPMKGLTKLALECIVLKTAKELSRIFEFQLSMLEGNDSVKTMAKAAVDLMVNLKEGEKFDVNTLLRKVLDSEDSMNKDELEVKSFVKKVTNKWNVSSVFRKTGLRECHPETEEKFLYWERHDSRAEKYGFRGEIFMVHENDTASQDNKYYLKSEIDKRDNNFNTVRESPKDEAAKFKAKHKTEKKIRSMFFNYKPYHCLVLNYEDLKSFQEVVRTDHTVPFADFVREKYEYSKNQPVKPVFRPLEPMTEPLNLNKANLRESDLTGANFAGFQLEECDFSKCVVLSGNFEKAIMNGAIFQGAYLFDCILDGAEARECSWSQAKLYHCQVFETDFRNPVNQLGHESWPGTDLGTAIQTDKDLKVKEERKP